MNVEFYFNLNKWYVLLSGINFKSSVCLIYKYIYLYVVVSISW